MSAEPRIEPRPAQGAAACWLGVVDYEPVWRRMQAYAGSRQADDPDLVWCLEHPPVYTLGANGQARHVLSPGDVPVIAVDRGGQVTYHGPGQLVVYPLLDLRRRRLGVRDLVAMLEGVVIDAVESLGIVAERRPGAPGVYVAGAKLASVGLRVRRQTTYHGLSVNVAMDLAPFAGINPCGYAGLEVTDLARLGSATTPREFASRLLLPALWNLLGEPPPFAWSTTGAPFSSAPH